MVEHNKMAPRSNFRKFFLRGLAILLPTVLTIGILIWAYNFVQDRIAQPINSGIKVVVIRLTPWPRLPHELVILPDPLSPDLRQIWSQTLNQKAQIAWEAQGYSTQWLRRHKRQVLLDKWWNKYAIGMDLIGLFVAVILIYVVGAFLGSFIGRRLYHRGEELLRKVPLIRQVYPSVKQVTDFLFGGAESRQTKFNQVVAVEYPRKGLWSIGLVTGDTIRKIADRVDAPCLTVFVPSSPTPFTGYVITVPKSDTIDLPITIEQALRYTVSGGVILPSSQRIGHDGHD